MSTVSLTSVGEKRTFDAAGLVNADTYSCTPNNHSVRKRRRVIVKAEKVKKENDKPSFKLCFECIDGSGVFGRMLHDSPRSSVVDPVSTPSNDTDDTEKLWEGLSRKEKDRIIRRNTHRNALHVDDRPIKWSSIVVSEKLNVHRNKNKSDLRGIRFAEVLEKERFFFKDAKPEDVREDCIDIVPEVDLWDDCIEDDFFSSLDPLADFDADMDLVLSKFETEKENCKA